MSTLVQNLATVLLLKLQYFLLLETVLFAFHYELRKVYCSQLTSDQWHNNVIQEVRVNKWEESPPYRSNYMQFWNSVLDMSSI